MSEPARDWQEAADAKSRAHNGGVYVPKPSATPEFVTAPLVDLDTLYTPPFSIT